MTREWELNVVSANDVSKLKKFFCVMALSIFSKTEFMRQLSAIILKLRCDSHMCLCESSYIYLPTPTSPPPPLKKMRLLSLFRFMIFLFRIFKILIDNSLKSILAVWGLRLQIKIFINFLISRFLSRLIDLQLKAELKVEARSFLWHF